jgi:hypothetical protein
MFGRRKPSQAQTEANRRNAQYSTGPKTEAGKNRSKNNAFRHGLTAQVTVMTDPDRDAQEKFIKAYIADISPEGFQETQLAQSLAHDQWRMNRIRAIEENAFLLGLDGPAGNIEAGHPEINAALANAGTFFNEPENFATLSLYEQRIHRNFHRNQKLYKDLRKEREANRKTHPQTVEEEKPKAMGASASAEQPANESTTSPENGFVQSNWNKAPDYVPMPPVAVPQPATAADTPPVTQAVHPTLSVHPSTLAGTPLVKKAA